MKSWLVWPSVVGFSSESRWITPPGAAQLKNCYFRARKLFQLAEVPESALLAITADSRYLLTINGCEVGSGPVRGTKNLIYFDLYDVAGLLKPGSNVVEVLVQNMMVPNFLTMPVEPALRCELAGIFASDESWTVALAPEWRRDVQLHTFQTGFSEWRDYRREPEAWAEPMFAQAVAPESELYRRELVARDVPELFTEEYPMCDLRFPASVPAADCAQTAIAELETREVHSPIGERLENANALLTASPSAPAVLYPAADGAGATFVANFDAEVLGSFLIDLEAPAGTVVDVIVEEELYGDRLRGEHLNENGYHFADRYILDGQRRTIGNFLAERGFRMIQVVFRNFSAPIRLYGIRARHKNYPYVRRGAFFCNDMLLNRIWEVCVETMVKCTTDIFTDCPWRERAFWVNDFIVENKSSLVAFGASSVHSRAFRLLFSQRHADALVDGVCPCSWEKGLSLVSTNLFTPLMLEDYLYYSGDCELARRYLPMVMQILDTFAAWTDGQGIVRVPKREGIWNFIDWSYDQNGRTFEGKPTAMVNLFYAIALQATIRLGRLLGETLPVERYSGQAQAAFDAVFRHFRHPELPCLADALDEQDRPLAWASELPHALALLTGLGDEREEAMCLAAFECDEAIVPEFYLHSFLFPALNAAGRADVSLARIRRFWGETIATGTPTLWESGIHHKGKKAFAESGSLCHGFGTAPLEFMQAVILGVKPLAPGFARYRLEPQTFDLDFAQGRIPTPFGNISVSWRRNAEGILTLDLDTPEGTVAELPDGREFRGCCQVVLN